MRVRVKDTATDGVTVGDTKYNAGESFDLPDDQIPDELRDRVEVAGIAPRQEADATAKQDQQQRQPRAKKE